MADFSVKIRADELGKSIAGIGDQLEQELNGAVSDLAHAAYARISANVQSQVGNQEFRQEYIKNLDIFEVGEGSWLVTLEGDWANRLEEGYDGYDMKQTLLNSNKNVTVGPRAGQPWVQEGPHGKFAHVPMQKQPHSKEAGKNLVEDINKITATNAAGRRQRITKIFRDATGKPIEGKVATGMSDNPELDRIAKYQKVGKTGSVSSTYINFRTISQQSSGWKHPGHDGYHFFKEAEEWVEAELDNIIETLL